jgi:hypothetical protein
MSILDLVSAVASESCLIVLIEDIHWMDEWSWDVMSALTKRLEKTGMLILMTRRDTDDQATPMPKDAVVRGMPLAPLDEARCRKLFGLVGPPKRVVEDDFVEWCVRTSAGNPYFLIELGRRAAKADGKFQAPPSLTRLIAERFLDVTPLSRRVLQAAAVLGKNSTLARIENVLDEKRVGLLDSLDELSRHSLVLSDGERVLCRHDLLGISALTDISALSLRLLHRHAAQALEAEIDDASTPAHLWDCARHLEGASDPNHSLELMQRCASRAMDMGVPREAVRALQYALEKHSGGAATVRLQRMLVRAFYLTREYTSLVALSRENRVERTEWGDGDCENSPEELYVLDAGHYSTGPTTQALEKSLRCALEQSASASHRVEAAVVCCKLASNLYTRDVAEKAHAAVLPLLDEADPATAAELRMVFEGSFGNADACGAAARAMRRVVRASRAGGLAIRSLGQCCEGLYLGGAIDEALECIREAAESCGPLEMPTANFWCIQCETKIHLALGDTTSATQSILRARKIRINRSELETIRDCEYEARVALLEGDDARGSRLLDELYRTLTPRWPRAVAHHTGLAMLPRVRSGCYQPSTLEMNELLQMHFDNRTKAHHDFFVYMLSFAFEARDEGATFQSLAKEYVTQHRFERGPLLAQLASRISRVT